MKRFMKYSVSMLAAAVALMSCGREFNEVETDQIPVFDTYTMKPAVTSEDSEEVAYRGDLVRFKGFNLNNVGRVEFAAEAQKVDAEIELQKLDTLCFRIPLTLDLAPSDYAHRTTLNIYDKKAACIFAVPFYITVPVGDAGVAGYTPTEGTVGTTITVEGDHLTLVSRVIFGGETIDRSDLAYSEDGLTLSFDVPVSETYAAGDSAIAISVEWDVNSASVTGDGNLFTLHTPAVGKISQSEAALPGSTVTVEGENLWLLDNVQWGSYTLWTAPDGGLDKSVTELTLTFPALSDINEQAEQVDGKYIVTLPVEAHWTGDGTTDMTVSINDGYKLDVTPADPPKFDALTKTDGALDIDGYFELTLTGENLLLVEKVMWGDYTLTVKEQTAGSLTVVFPTADEMPEADAKPHDHALTAVYGGNQTLTIADSFKIDYTPVGAGEPQVSTVTAADGGADNKFYLGKTVTVEGQSLDSVVQVKLGDETAEILDGCSETQLQFLVPEGYTFDTATEQTLTFIYGPSRTEKEIGTYKVYPFYFYKGIRLGLGSNSSNTYTEYASENAFFIPDQGRVCSVSEFVNEKIDPYIFGNANPYMSEANKLTGATADIYYAAVPYIFLTCDSSNKVAFCNQSNSNSVLERHYYHQDGATGWSKIISAKQFGTPILTFRNLMESTSADKVVKESIMNGTLSTITGYTTNPGSSGPAHVQNDADESTSTWQKGSVLFMAYSNFACGGKTGKSDDFAKVGFIVVSEITFVDEKGNANANRDGYIEFDMYYSKWINK